MGFPVGANQAEMLPLYIQIHLGLVGTSEFAYIMTFWTRQGEMLWGAAAQVPSTCPRGATEIVCQPRHQAGDKGTCACGPLQLQATVHLQQQQHKLLWTQAAQ